MNKILTVSLAASLVMGITTQAKADLIAKDVYEVNFTGAPGARVRGSIVWTDVSNLNRPTYMESVDGSSQATKILTIPAGSIVSASGSSDSIKPVVIKILRNRIECDDSPSGSQTMGNVKTCTP